jgi:ribose-phosphate pyrophosphokinase
MSLKVFETREDGMIKKIGLSELVFPGGEVGVRLDAFNPGHVYISAVLRNSEEVMKLLMLTDAIRRADPSGIIDLDLPYVPYARQDRVMTPGESLSIKVFCDLINTQKYNKVVIWDPHSDVTPALLNNCVIQSQAIVLRNQLPFGASNHGTHSRFERSLSIKEAFIENTVLVAPDAGASKKIGEVAKMMGFTEVIQANKVREVATGKILETTVNTRHIGDKNFLIVDDICDGGRTFLELAKVLRPFTNGKIILYVTHGIFSANLGVFKGVIDEVYCANSFGQYPEFHNLAGVLPDNGHFAKT